MTMLIDGKAISAQLKDELKSEVARMSKRGRTVTLAVVLVGNDPASCVYVKNKKKACEYIGIRSLSYELAEDTTENELLRLVHSLNQREDVDGILVQLPLPPHIREQVIIEAIRPDKDVDGFHPYNVGALSTGQRGFISCTPAGIIELLHRCDIKTEGQECVIVGRSNIVGKPMAMLLLHKNGTVTIAHSKTKNLKEVCASADILVAAVGVPKLIKGDMIKPGAVVIDVGTTKMPDGKLCGDVDFEAASKVAGYITPVPGGVGPMTRVILMKNTVTAAKIQNKVKI